MAAPDASVDPHDELVPIDEVARRFGLRASALRYYESRGLLSPSARHAGRRWYGAADIRRLAVIRYWQESGMLSLDAIGEMLAASAHDGTWHAVVQGHVDDLGTRITQMTAAKDFLEHVLSHHDGAPDGCPHYEALIWRSSGDGPAGAHDHAHDHAL